MIAKFATVPIEVGFKAKIINFPGSKICDA